MRIDKNGRSSYFREKILIEMNFFYHKYNMGVEVILHRDSPHIYFIHFPFFPLTPQMSVVHHTLALAVAN